MTTLFFIYQNAENLLSAHSVSNAIEKGNYIQGFCFSSNGLRTFRNDRVVEFVESDSDLEPRLLYWQDNQASIPYKAHQLEIHFTGFKEADKVRLSTVTQDAGMLVRSSLSGYVDILCYGYNAGAKKLEQARDKKLLILSESELINLLATGEISQ